jgi:hypothetical protein
VTKFNNVMKVNLILPAIFGITVFLATPTEAAISDTPIEDLWRNAPKLHSLYAAYPSLHQKLGAYADMQGFKGSRERLATIVHELIHVDSAANQAYMILGVGYAPYNEPDAWPLYNFAQFREARERVNITGIRESTSTAVFHLYITNTPSNTLANLADELNAYGQTAPWLCKQNPTPPSYSDLSAAPQIDESRKTVASLRDMLRTTDAYLRVLRAEAPAEYQSLNTHKRQARNLLALTVLNALRGLEICGIQLPPKERYELDALVMRSQKEASQK